MIQKEGRKEMRRFNSKRKWHSANVNITHVTNTTYVTNVIHTGGRHEKWRGHRHGHGSKRNKIARMRKERPPKLLRFLASFGMVDRDVASRMDNGELCYESAKVAGYGARRLAKNVHDVGSGLYGATQCLVGGVRDALGAIFS